MRTWKITERMQQSERMQRCQLGDCKAACCLYGVWLDREEQDKITANWELISAHMRDPDLGVDECFGDEWEEDYFTPSGVVVHSHVIADSAHYGGTACIFLREDHKCALQVAGEAAGLHPWHFKPFYCILHPLDLDESGNITLDRTADMISEPGSCLRPAAEAIPLYKTFEAELRYFMGDANYERSFCEADET